MKTEVITSIDLIQSPGPHQYSVCTRDGKTFVLPSPSSILSVVNKEGLNQWYGRLGLSEATRLRDEAANIGSSVHEFIHRINGGEVINAPEWLSLPEATRNSIKAFVRWKMKNKCIPVHSELKVCSLTLGYAGTLDTVVEIDGRNYIIDWKTSAYTSHSYLMQMAAYFYAYQEMEIKPEVSGCRCVKLNKETGIPSEHCLLGKHELESAMLAFESAMNIHKYIKEVKIVN